MGNAHSSSLGHNIFSMRMSRSRTPTPCMYIQDRDEFQALDVYTTVCLRCFQVSYVSIITVCGMTRLQATLGTSPLNQKIKSGLCHTSITVTNREAKHNTEANATLFSHFRSYNELKILEYKSTPYAVGLAKRNWLKTVENQVHARGPCKARTTQQENIWPGKYTDGGGTKANR
jgi:hypothetical protein